MDAGTTSREGLIQQQLMAETEFSEELEEFWKQLKQKTGGIEKIEYWDFVGAETFEETVKRAYMLSFIVTYGYATLEVDRLEEIVYIKPYAAASPENARKLTASIPIPVSMEDWKNWKEGTRK